jgi:sulfatase modifying factor 1
VAAKKTHGASEGGPNQAHDKGTPTSLRGMAPGAARELVLQTISMTEATLRAMSNGLARLVACRDGDADIPVRLRVTSAELYGDFHLRTWDGIGPAEFEIHFVAKRGYEAPRSLVHRLAKLLYREGGFVVGNHHSGRDFVEALCEGYAVFEFWDFFGVVSEADEKAKAFSLNLEVVCRARQLPAVVEILGQYARFATLEPTDQPIAWDEAWSPKTPPVVKDATSWIAAKGSDHFGDWAMASIADIDVKFRWCPPGTFLARSKATTSGASSDEFHEVVVTRGFWLGETPVTQALWNAVLGGSMSEFRGESRPVECVSWRECKRFFKELNALEPALRARFPTEAEWELACRAGTTGPTWRGPNDQTTLDAIAWYEPNSSGTTQPVGLKEPNPWGLFDMLGNVWEWCSDYDGEPAASRVVDPTGPASGTKRICRGGSFGNTATVISAAFRNSFRPGEAHGRVGVRLLVGG